MFEKTIGITGIVVASLTVASLWASAAPAAGWGQPEDVREKLQAKLPAGFPIPAGTLDVGRAGEGKVECEVPGTTAEKLVGFFRQELPKKGFTIVAQNPPRVTSYESPVTLIFKTAEGKTGSVQVYTKKSGDLIFTVS